MSQKIILSSLSNITPNLPRSRECPICVVRKRQRFGLPAVANIICDNCGWAVCKYCIVVIEKNINDMSFEELVTLEYGPIMEAYCLECWNKDMHRGHEH